MRIAIDCRMFNESGVGRYIRNLLSQLQKLDQENQYFIFLLKNDFDKLKFPKNFTKILANFRWYGISEQIKLPQIIKHLNVDLTHFPHFNVPVFLKGKFVVIIHDLIHQHFSMERATTHGPFVYKLKQFGYRQVFKHAIKNTEKILVPSNFVKNQLLEDWGVAEKKIVVTYEAVDEKIIRLVGKKTTSSYQLPVTNYLFYVGNAHPHKNMDGLIKAFLLLKKKHGSLKLVLSGFDHYFWQRVKKEYQDDGIIYRGFVPDEELVVLYMGAECFVLPSFEEGFGIPLLEAMACSCPVVSSNAGSLPEIGGDAAIYFDPYDIDDMVDKISVVLDNEKLSRELVEKGKKRYKQFSWKNLAKKTLEVYHQCI